MIGIHWVGQFLLAMEEKMAPEKPEEGFSHVDGTEGLVGAEVLRQESKEQVREMGSRQFAGRIENLKEKWGKISPEGEIIEF